MGRKFCHRVVHRRSNNALIHSHFYIRPFESRCHTRQFKSSNGCTHLHLPSDILIKYVNVERRSKIQVGQTLTHNHIVNGHDVDTITERRPLHDDSVYGDSRNASLSCSLVKHGAHLVSQPFTIRCAGSMAMHRIGNSSLA